MSVEIPLPSLWSDGFSGQSVDLALLVSITTLFGAGVIFWVYFSSSSLFFSSAIRHLGGDGSSKCPSVGERETIQTVIADRVCTQRSKCLDPSL